MNAVAARTSVESQINSMKKKKDWYRDYFNNMKKVFRLKQNAIDQCMDKVDKMLTARSNGIALTGQREAYAANIMKLVCTELNLPLRMKDISRVSNNPKPQALTNSHKKLKSVFKEWFRNYKTPLSLMPKFCASLGLSEQLTEDALKIVDKIHKEGKLEGCQPPTIVGVSLYLLNNRIGLNLKNPICQEAKQFRLNEQDIAETVGIGLQTIKEKYDRVRDSEIFVLPDHWLLEKERLYLKQVEEHNQLILQQE